MADQGRWFKLWNTAPGDGKIQALCPAHRWAWAAFGCYTKVHGDHGKVVVLESNAVLAAEMGVTVDALFSVILSFPNMLFEEGEIDNGKLTVTWLKWKQYQEDSTVYERVKKWRQSKSVTVQEEKRREEKRREKNGVAPGASAAGANGFSAWPEEWTPIRDLVTGPHALPFLASYQRWLVDLDWWTTMRALYAPLPLPQLLTDAVAYIQGEGYHPRTKAAIRQKLRNCMEFAAKKTERGRQATLTSPSDPYAKFPRIS